MQEPNRPVVTWLAICCLMVVAIVPIGGITRLTESGLSITEWRPLTGALPPLSEAEWRREFELYQRIPQYQQINRGMTLAEFKTIFWWEYIHRLWGRLIGLVFAAPFLWFLLRGRVRGSLAWRLAGALVLGGLQGAIGWWMVASGLEDRTSVSPVRLKIHLLLALLIFAWLFWILLDLTRGRIRMTMLSRHALGLGALTFVTIATGALVAGNRAGLAYNTFPLMDGAITPEFYLDPALGFWRSLIEHVPAVQFNHRLLAAITLAACIFFWRAARAHKVAALVPLAAMLQFALGVTTLVLVVPLSVAVLHQLGAIGLLASCLFAAHATGARSG
jgi:heme a synthase